MHDGSMETLEEVIDHYAAGGRPIRAGPDAGDGRTSPLKSAFVGGFELTAQEKDDLIAFLHALTDDALVSDPAFAAP
jgi:cytochrome c peroxidase